MVTKIGDQSPKLLKNYQVVSKNGQNEFIMYKLNKIQQNPAILLNKQYKNKQKVMKEIT